MAHTERRGGKKSNGRGGDWRSKIRTPQNPLMNLRDRTWGGKKWGKNFDKKTQLTRVGQKRFKTSTCSQRKGNLGNYINGGKKKKRKEVEQRTQNYGEENTTKENWDKRGDYSTLSQEP